MGFFEEAGRMALGSRLRAMADKVTENASLIYSAYETNLEPKWFPVFYVISKNKNSTVTSIADEIGHSHVSVIKILKEMSAAGLVETTADRKDKRRTMINLSASGRKVANKIENQYADVNAAMAEISREATHDLWEALEEWDQLLSRKSLLERVIDKKRKRELAKCRAVRKD